MSRKKAVTPLGCGPRLVRALARLAAHARMELLFSRARVGWEIRRETVLRTLRCAMRQDRTRCVALRCVAVVHCSLTLCELVDVAEFNRESPGQGRSVGTCLFNVQNNLLQFCRYNIYSPRTESPDMLVILGIGHGAFTAKKGNQPLTQIIQSSFL